MANKDFGTMKTNIGSDLQDSSSSFATILGRYINKRYFQVLRRMNFEQSNPYYSFSTVAGTQNYALPEDFGKEKYVLNSSTGVELVRCSIEELVRYYPDTIAGSGSVERYAIYDDVVQNQPTSASTLSIVSSSASDTTQTVLVRGTVAGAENYETVTLTGTTPVVTTNSYTRVRGISKSAATTGKVTVTSNSGAVTNAVLSRDMLSSLYKIIKLHYVPTSVQTIQCPYIVKPLPLTNSNDYPIIDISDLIEIGASADGWRYKRQFQKAADMDGVFERELLAFIYDRENQPNEIFKFNPKTYDRDLLY